MDNANLIDHPYLVCQGKKKWKPSSRLYKRVIKSASIIISDWWLGKQLRPISQKKKNEKKWPIMLIWGFFKKPSKSIFSLWPQTEDLVLESQINYHFENFPNRSEERKRRRSTLLFIDLNKFWRKKKNRAWLVLIQSENQTVQIFITPQ